MNFPHTYIVQASGLRASISTYAMRFLEVNLGSADPQLARAFSGLVQMMTCRAHEVSKPDREASKTLWRLYQATINGYSKVRLAKLHKHPHWTLILRALSASPEFKAFYASNSTLQKH